MPVELFPEEGCVQIERTEEFLKETKMLSAYIFELSLTNEQNDELIKLIAALTHATEHSAFKQGFSLGVEIGHAAESNK